MLISVVIPTYRRAAVLQSTLTTLCGSDISAADYEVIVVDDDWDSAAAAVAEVLQATEVSLTYIPNRRHGAAAARNTGAQVARAEVVLFLDDDMRVGRDHLRRHLDTRRQYPDALIGGDRWYSAEALAALQSTSFGRYRIALERGYARGRDEARRAVGVSEVVTLPSFDLSIERQAFWRIGGFDESFPYAGAEDQDLSHRARKSGLSLIRDHEIRLLHDDNTTTLREFALREERGAHTVLALVRKFPEYEGEFRRNRQVSTEDPPSLIVMKLVKATLSARLVLNGLHGLVKCLERMKLPDRYIGPLYRMILGLHIFRGYRHALRTTPGSKGA